MIPTPQRVRANRLWSAALAAAVAAMVAAFAWIASPGGVGFYVALAVAAGGAAGLYRFGTRVWRRRRKVLARPFPPEWEEVLDRRVTFFALLDDEEKQRFRKLTAIFLDETPITAVGCELDDTCRVLIAASAVVPVLGLGGWEYGMLREVLLHAGEFRARMRADDDRADPLLGMVGNTGGAFNGVLALSKNSLLHGFAVGDDKHNVGIHEFAHLVDKADGAIDGVPASLPSEALRPWLALVRREMEDGSGGWSDIPDYAFTGEQEFFAVATEYFFEAPEQLASRHRELYDMLRRIFRQDPLARLRRRRERQRPAP
jgi:Mlc titration factor MtfA (ptsG expression regulator)